MKTREDRRATFIPARARTSRGWIDVVIRNASGHGAMLQTSRPAPRRGEYIEIRRDTMVVVGCITWSKANRCGVNIREKIAFDELLGDTMNVLQPAGQDRRRIARSASPRKINSKYHSRVAATAALITGICVAALLIGGIVWPIMRQFPQAVASALT